ncbi:MAG: RNA polymerase-associated protein RapA [Anaerolineae bacterium]|nr:RNA polymerase-associated protein RapA [Anaerolineae bacterium]
MSNPRGSGSDLFIVDNSDTDWKVVRYLHQWAEIAHTIDIATGYFEISALLALDGQWQKLDKIRLLMGDEVSMKTKQAFEAGLANITGKLDDSLEAAKEDNDFLNGVPAIVEAIHTQKIEARVYRKKKFHAKAYITYPKLDVIGSAALVGSSNFTYPGMHQNVELNINLRQANEVRLLQEWYEEHWAEAEDVTPDILKTIERHTREYSPFEIYARAMSAYYQGHQLTVGEWEKHESKMYPELDQYQREGYQQLMKIARNYKGALLCDGVGLGKTFVGLMVIERLLFERKRVALFVPKATRQDVWEAKLRRFLPGVRGRLSNLVIYNHTDLLREGEYPELMAEVAEKVDAIVVDEAHHFRNIGSNRYRKFFEITEGKEMFLLTATPVNNSLYDLMHMIELFSRRESGYFSGPPLGIHALRGHFRRMETALAELVSGNGNNVVDLDAVKAEDVLNQDDLFRALVVQRSRAYVRRSLAQQGGRSIAFPERKDPQVADYSLKKTYGGLLDSLEKAFKKEKPLVSLPIYNPINYEIGKDGERDPFQVGRQTQVVALIRTLLLKRFESSAKAFESSCEDLLLKLLQFARLHAPKAADRWEAQHADLIKSIKEHLGQRGLHADEDDEGLDEDFIPEEFKQKIEKLSDKKYNVTEMVLEVMLDLDQLAEFLEELGHFNPSHDDKLQALITLLQTHPVLKEHKVLIFTEYMATARYLEVELKKAGIGPLLQVDSARQNQSSAVHAFSPYYNESSSAELKTQGMTEVRLLIATDVLSEGLNLQDATCIINYDLHWNPVRLMQRIGRVDRRLDPAVEAVMVADHPELTDIRGIVYLWNFLPPAELNQLLTLYHRVTHKTLRISKTFGIEGKKLLTPDDDYEALKNFNEAYEGKTTSAEEMYLAYQQLLQDYPDLMERIDRLPLRVFSGKGWDDTPSATARALFLCYRLPAKDALSGEWTDEASITRWYLYDLVTETIEEEATRIFEHIRCQPDTQRKTVAPQQTLSDIRAALDKHIKNSYEKKVQAPIGTKSTLLAWMELV